MKTFCFSIGLLVIDIHAYLSTARLLECSTSPSEVGSYHRNLIGATLESRNHVLSRGDLESAARSHLAQVTGLDAGGFHVVGAHNNDAGMRHIYFREKVNDLEVYNGIFNINILTDGTVFSYGQDFEPRQTQHIQQIPRSTSHEAVTAFRQRMSLNTDFDSEVQLGYYRIEQGLKLVWHIESQSSERTVHGFVDSDDVNIIYNVFDSIYDIGLRVYDFSDVENPLKGERVRLSDHSGLSSWFDLNSSFPLATKGNNAEARYVGIDTRNIKITDILDHPLQDADNARNFDFPLDFTADPMTWINASVTQAFYTINMCHDLFLSLGFTEAAGNFQEINYSGEGLGNDSVVIGVRISQSSLYSHAPEGQHPFIIVGFDTTITPPRDGSFDRGSLVHEMGHGLSTRLVGSAGEVYCLVSGESGGLGEGWSDFRAEAVDASMATDRNSSQCVFGSYFQTATSSYRPYPFSTNVNINPQVYSDLSNTTYTSHGQDVHAIGSIWSVIMYEMLWNFIDEHGNSKDVFPTFVDGSKLPNNGRHILMKLVLESFKMTPYNPTFLTAREALLDTETVYTNGTNACLIWKAFAKRGLGVNASSTRNATTGDRTYRNSFELPTECLGT